MVPPSCIGPQTFHVAFDTADIYSGAQFIRKVKLTQVIHSSSYKIQCALAINVCTFLEGYDLLWKDVFLSLILCAERGELTHY